MTGRATVAQLDRELQRQAAALHAELALTQQDLADSQEEVRILSADLAAVRLHLGAARRELQWLRRAGIDLNRAMDHPLLRAPRNAGRAVRAVLRRAKRLIRT